MLFYLRKLAMENQYEWQAVIGVAIFAGSWIGLSLLRRHLNRVKIRRFKKHWQGIQQKLGNDGGTNFS
jgi:hypothetical protein